MKILLTRISPTHHRLVCVRTDGSQKTVELETKTFLFHDLLHLAAESRAGIQGGFWGSLASGKSLAEMNMKSEVMEAFTPQTELDCMEIVVGALTGAWKSEGKGMNLAESLNGIFTAYGKPMPFYVTEEYETEVLLRMKQLWGEWSSLAFGQTMMLEWTHNA